jgi:hypothetical protein
MNDKQKIFVMVGLGSVVIFPISVVSNVHFEFSSFNQMFGSLSHTNWLGIIAVFNIVVSITGFFLFKDK